MNIEKAKDKARKLELKGQNDKALEVYETILEELQGTPQLESELALYNKVGDLYLKANNTQKAVDTYERAADLYEKAGFPNNAIALCNKILRNAPGRTNVYLKLAKLMLARGFAAEAKQNLLEYADRMQKGGQLEQAFRALKEFADLSPDNEEIRLVLAEQLKAAARTDEAREQLAKLYAEVEHQGDERRTRSTLSKMKAIDPDFDPEGAPKHKVQPKKKKSSELVFLNLDETPEEEVEETPVAMVEPEPEPEPSPTAAEPLEIEPTAVEGLAEEEVLEEPVEKVETEEDVIERASAEYLAVQDEPENRLAGLETMESFEQTRDSVATPSLDIETTAIEEPAAAAPEEEESAEEVEEIETVAEVMEAAQEEAIAETPGLLDLGESIEETVETEEASIEVPDLDLDLGDLAEEEKEAEEAPAAAELPSLDLDEEVVEVAAPAAPTIEDLENRVAENPGDPAAHQALGEALIEQGDRERGLEELEHALNAAEKEHEWDIADAVADEIIRLDPNSVRHHQKRVEFAYRRNDKSRLVKAYLGLADALFRQGSMERARAVYQRVLEHDPDNESANTAIATIEPPEPSPTEPSAPTPAPAGSRQGSGGDFVDLGALVLEEEPAMKDLRMRIEEEEPSGDEERDFAEMLAHFKRGIEENVADEDWQAHFDLGVAFKEMGLLDEAIAEFQKALRSIDGRLKSAEALGVCFYEKGQFSVASTVLRRAIESDKRSDEEKIGLLYWVGRSEEEQGRGQTALDFYQRVFAVDIKFQDVSERVKSLASAER